jgi:hypothetical protein
MLANFVNQQWWYMEIPRTGSSTIDRGLRRFFPYAHSIYQKHWPITPAPFMHKDLKEVFGFTSIRNPYSRAVSCWQFFTHPGKISFLDWTKQRLDYGFTDTQIEARPQQFWFQLHQWQAVIRQEHLEYDFWQIAQKLNSRLTPMPLVRYNDINGPWINRVKAKTSRDKPWQEYYCEESKENVFKLYQDDFKCLATWYSGEFPTIADTTVSTV